MLSFRPTGVWSDYTLERSIERRLGALGRRRWACSQGRLPWSSPTGRPQRRGRGEATTLDGLASESPRRRLWHRASRRNGATLAAARWRCFTREQPNLLSRNGRASDHRRARLLKGARLHGRGTDPSLRKAMGIGVARVRLCARLAEAIRQVERDRALWPYAAYRPVWPRSWLARLGPCAGDRRLRSIEADRDRRPRKGDVSAQGSRAAWNDTDVLRQRRGRPGRGRLGGIRAGRASVRSSWVGRPAQVPLVRALRERIRIDERTGIALSTDGVGTSWRSPSSSVAMTASASTACDERQRRDLRRGRAWRCSTTSQPRSRMSKSAVRSASGLPRSAGRRDEIPAGAGPARRLVRGFDLPEPVSDRRLGRDRRCSAIEPATRSSAFPHPVFTPMATRSPPGARRHPAR